MKTNYTTQPEKAYEKPGEWGTIQYTSISYEMPALNAFVEESEKDYSNEYLTTVALEDGTISFNVRFDMGTEYITSISYSTDNGKTWTTTANQDDKEENLVIDVHVNKGDKVLWKGIATQTGCWSPNDSVDDLVGSFFSSDCAFDASGNVMSLLYNDEFKGETAIKNSYEFACLFSDYDGENECLVANAKDLSLPATTLMNACYQFMFYNCRNLITTPELPAVTLANNCYNGMFMDCSSLTTAPELPAITLANLCYSCMFKDCKNLIIAPELPATTLANLCYLQMFDGCTSLITAPELPATTLAEDCYLGMFFNCENLNSITCLATDIIALRCTTYWVEGVAANGTFTKAADMEAWTTGVNGIPAGWTVQNAYETDVNVVDDAVKVTRITVGGQEVTVGSALATALEGGDTVDIYGVGFTTDNTKMVGLNSGVAFDYDSQEPNHFSWTVPNVEEMVAVKVNGASVLTFWCMG